VSNDNPYSESQFKTLKYRPSFPGQFGSIQQARAWCQDFFPWYNHEHRHSGLALHTAASVHHDRTGPIQAARASVLSTAYATHPERFVRKPPAPPQTAGHRLDQRAPGERRNHSVEAPRRRLKKVDRFRAGRVLPAEGLRKAAGHPCSRDRAVSSAPVLTVRQP